MAVRILRKYPIRVTIPIIVIRQRNLWQIGSPVARSSLSMSFTRYEPSLVIFYKNALFIDIRGHVDYIVGVKYNADLAVKGLTQRPIDISGKILCQVLVQHVICGKKTLQNCPPYSKEIARKIQPLFKPVSYSRRAFCLYLVNTTAEEGRLTTHIIIFIFQFF